MPVSNPDPARAAAADRSRLEQAIACLEPLVTPARAQRLRTVLATRTDHVAFVFERMIDPHNLSAALRSLDAFSFQDVHVVHPGERLGLSRGITIGAERWLTLRQAPTTADCLAELRQAGYRLYASRLEGEPVALTELDFSQRVALVFGNEHLGVSEEMLAGADATFRIDMLGFAQSFNLSVSVALCAFHARQALERLAARDGHPERRLLAPERRAALHLRWLCRSVRSAERVLAEAGLGDLLEEAQP